jgi:Cu/Ag efflux protein CusF
MAGTTRSVAGAQLRDFTAQTITSRATIVAIDPKTRMVTLKGPSGQNFEVHADERVQRFNQLKVGDIVTATYSQALAVRIRKPGAPAPSKQTESLVRSTDSVQATLTREQTITVVILEVNLVAPSVTAEGPQKRQYTFQVRDKSEIQDLKVGDKVDVTYTEAVLVRADGAK